MKLYVQDGEIFFDYTDVDINARLNDAESQSRHFLYETNCGWVETKRKQLVKMYFEPYSWATEYGNARSYENLLKNCYYTAKKFPLIEIAPEVSELLVSAAKHCYELHKIEEVKEQQRRANEKWQELCKYGCSNCHNKVRKGDDYFCGATGELLPEKNQPKDFGRVHYPFNNEAFPTENCPYNLNKNKEAV